MSSSRVVNRVGVRAGSMVRVWVRTWVRIGAMLMLVAAVLTLPGCGGVEGTYVAEEKLPDGGTGKITLELKGGGVAVATISAPGGMSLPSVTGTYTVEGGKVITVLDNDRDEWTMNGDTLTSNLFGEKVTLTKQ